ncbi:MAG: DUF58 domain-containing protein [Planctomycetota bacterium]|nr:DUF58 domain-containing protein [Planctomycetota bacterium]
MKILDTALIRILERLAQEVKRSATGSQAAGARKGSLKGGDEEFAEHRPYHFGDDLRRIDLKPYLRLDELVTKVFARSTAGNVHVMLDTSASMAAFDSKRVFALRLAAAMGYLALCSSDRLTVWLLSDGKALPSPRMDGKQNIARLVNFLEGVRFSGRTAIADSLASSALEIPGRGETVLISDLCDEGDFIAPLRALSARRWNVSVLHVMDRREYAPEKLGSANLTDVETGETLDTWLGDEAVSIYRELFARRLDRISGQLSSARTSYYPAKTDTELTALIRRTFGL